MSIFSDLYRVVGHEWVSGRQAAVHFPAESWLGIVSQQLAASRSGINRRLSHQCDNELRVLVYFRVDLQSGCQFVDQHQHLFAESPTSVLSCFVAVGGTNFGSMSHWGSRLRPRSALTSLINISVFEGVSQPRFLHSLNLDFVHSL